MDTDFLDRIMGAEVGVGRVDDFVGKLWTGWKAIREQGVAQPLHLGLFRSDYLLHSPSADEPVSLKQVEFNTISSSFGPLSQQTAALHRYLYNSTRYYDTSPQLRPENFPPNTTLSGLASGLAEGHKAYGVPEAHILFVVQDGERNVFDQRWLEYELLEKHSIHVTRQTLTQLTSSASTNARTSALIISPATEVSVVYFRAGYTPNDFTQPAHFEARFLLEKSRAIKCPSIPLQLAGGKKVQEVLAKPGVVEQFLKDQGEDVIREIRASWMGMWGLDDDEESIDAAGNVVGDTMTKDTEAEREPAGLKRALANYANLVLKPQREGGGNNVYKASIPPFLASLPPQERAAWISMELIVPPQGLGNYLVRSGGGHVKAEVVSELGIFGWALFGGEERKVVKEEEAGWLVRTKGRENDEGGVAAGFSVLDSILLVD
ncbi:glutathione synthase [Gloeophyllum trabeum ATCC 11539]|uniref:Glutathione synthetase n=1 Tax=Gloeophyllum trabeum (strain ATCC 11539 / FP-39264 / Madison 617) TaxID=670483 RepID=S7Q5Y4_GLOTA|nr:glutathione synthase [Gloeophyllum trabeum ATCC 11539]EPQ54873.1 glutathione synthase [Gloeophyllum trabeum ATCC 11539]